MQLSSQTKGGSTLPCRADGVLQYGGGESFRDYLYVGDAAQAFLHALALPPPGGPQVINIAGAHCASGCLSLTISFSAQG